MTRIGAHGRWYAVLLLALLAGCATTHQPAPVEDRSPGSAAPDAPARDTRAMERLPDPAPATGVLTFPVPESTPRAPDAAEREPTASETAPRAEPLRTPPAANPAVVALLNRANQDADGGRHDTAAASLERAIKIEPGNPWLWHRLAATRLAQGRPGDAAALAAKSNSLAVGDPGLQAENWRLIARVHRERGEDVAARAAEQRARELAAKTS